MTKQVANDRDSGLALILILLIIAMITQKSLLLIPITILLVLVMTVPVVFRPFSIIWFGLSSILGHCSSVIILSIL
ncbi:MAG: hypothetical protein HQK62_10620, partial [Desulfamplus sp.]|nr:hypothetical protein [Desulfamplus sp.]